MSLPKALLHLQKVDPKMARLIRKVGPCGFRAERAHRHNVHAVFEMLVHSVAHQQLTGKAASTIWQRMIALFPGKKFPTPGDLLEISIAQLRAAGFSGAKVVALKDIAAKTMDGTVPPAHETPRLDDALLIERLTQIRGVGQWTVEMLLMFELGRLDILPAGDFGVRKGFALTYKLADLPKPKELLEHGERWRPYRSIAAWYLWRAVDLHRKKPEK